MKLNVTQVLRHLPKPNCKECGEPTCMVFATKLLKKEQTLEACRPLWQSEFTEKRKALEGILMAA